MKKQLMIIITALLIFSTEATAIAKENNLINTGITPNGITYEVYGTPALAQGAFSDVTRNITYHGKVTPPSTLEWSEINNGITYTGTLKLYMYTYNAKANTTSASYRGTLKVN